MIKFLRSFAISILSLFSMGTVFAAEMPYTDVPAIAPYASAVQELYDSRIITDDGSHLFRPTDLMARDFFVSLAVGIGCHECMTPSVTDIVRYQVSPFVDLPKVNQYYYCIAYAKEYGITQGYILNEVGQSTCENSQMYTSSPFCASNTITRIEAAAILLRRAKLWNDTLNSTNFDRSLSIPDTTPYWYGYAKKAIEINIITPGSDGKIGQDVKITRGEFAVMAARILRYTQCKTDANTSTVPLEIVVRDTSGNIVPRTTFVQGSSGSLSTIAGTGVWDRIWTLTNPTTGEILTGTNESYPLSGLSCGTWINTVDLIERTTRQIVSTASNTITIECSEQRANPPLSVGITANPLTAAIGSPIDFASVVSGGNGVLSYRWDYGDSTTNTSSGATSHSYTDNGAYTVTLTITDARGNVARSSVVVVITGDRDTDRDGMIDIRDQCPLVYAQTASGCPMIDTYADSTKTSTVPVEIIVRDTIGNIVPRTVFPQGSSGSLSTIAGNGVWDRIWTLTNPTTGEILTGTSESYPLAGLSCSSWINTVDLIDRTTRQIASTASNTITIECSEQRANPPLSVGITANPLTAAIGSPINFASIVSGGSGAVSYRWDYGDGTMSTSSGATSHSYTDNGAYTVTLTITDARGNVARSSVVVVIGSIATNNQTSNYSFGNICLDKKSKIQGLLIGTPNCTQCPCTNSITISSSLRSCDIVFPTILSPALDTVYSRGGFFLIP